MRTSTEPSARGASDDIPGLGRVEQLVLRGDGLTTTSLEILTGTPIDVVVDEHWLLPLHDALETLADQGSGYTGTSAHQTGEAVRDAYDLLDAHGDETLLVREIGHRGRDGRRYGASRAVIVLDRLPVDVARRLASSDEPIGRALAASAVTVDRELRRWGLSPCGPRARRLSGAVRAGDPLPSRRYLMRRRDDGRPMAGFTEWFAPCVFGR
ncbi:hypothetical protein CLV56_2580 [Mumia flava]|uniref:Uncharacterized protein n=1 Tax=Mumia flava TaxID=1348852 RepID=A0A2M9BK52_9ACTN|nr:DUF98 domain-containing protein [Mumia flava]PJJ58329.1 hypothetical protein CLV56_2580 [Mumia flava]